MLLIFCWVRVWIVCQFELQKFESFLEQLKPFEKFSPVPLSQLLTYAGSLAMTFDKPVLLLCILVWSISRGSDVVSGEINRGTMEMLLSQPISRLRLLSTHAAVCVGGLLSLCGCVWLGLYLGIHTNSVKETVTPTLELSLLFIPIQVPIQIGASETVLVPLHERVHASLYLASTLNLFAFGFVVLAFSVMCSAVDRFRWRTIGIVVSVYILQLLLFLLSKAAEFTHFGAALTILSCYQPDVIVQVQRVNSEAGWSLFSDSSQLPLGLGPLGVSLMLIVIGLMFFAVAIYCFKRRDIPAPL